MTTKSTTTGIGAHEKIEFILLAQISADPRDNCRANLGQGDAGNKEQDQGKYALVKASIKAEGQDTPIILRKNTKPDAKSKPWRLVAGFRRFAIIGELAEESGNKKPTIKAVIRNLDDRQAAALNLRENTARDNLGPADLAFGVKRYYDESGLAGVEPTQQQAADSLGLNQGYVSKLNKIMKTLPNDVLKSWRESSVEISYVDVLKLCDLPKEEQQEAWDKLLRNKSDNGDGRSTGEGRTSWIDSAKEKAETMGKLLGRLERDGFITVNTLGNLMEKDNIRKIVPFKKDADAETVEDIADQLEVGYKAGLKGEPKKEEQEVSTEKPKGKGKNGATVQA